MAEPPDTNIWFLIGSAIGGIVTGVGSILGINKVREKGEGNVPELQKVKEELAEAKEIIKVHDHFYKTTTTTMSQIHDSLKRLHERVDDIAVSVARIQGIDEGRNSK